MLTCLKILQKKPGIGTIQTEDQSWTYRINSIAQPTAPSRKKETPVFRFTPPPGWGPPRIITDLNVGTPRAQKVTSRVTNEPPPVPRDVPPTPKLTDSWAAAAVATHMWPDAFRTSPPASHSGSRSRAASHSGSRAPTANPWGPRSPSASSRLPAPCPWSDSSSAPTFGSPSNYIPQASCSPRSRMPSAPPCPPRSSPPTPSFSRCSSSQNSSLFSGSQWAGSSQSSPRAFSSGSPIQSPTATPGRSLVATSSHSGNSDSAASGKSSSKSRVSP